MEKQYRHIRLMKSDFLEKFTFVHPAVPFILYLPFVFALLVFGGGLFSNKIFAFCFGVLCWTLSEYLFHRFLFHYHARTKFGQRIMFLIHGVHHEDPNDPLRLVMPPILSLLLSIPVLTTFWLLVPSEYFYGFTAGFYVGYLAYDFTHYYVHHFTPTTKLGKILKRNHLMHHFKDPDLKYGVSNPFWDFVFRTYK